MSQEAITDSAGLNGPVTEKAAPRKRTASSTRAAKKAATEAPVEIENVVIEEAKSEDVNDDGQKVITGPKKGRPARRSNSFVTETGAVGSRAADAALNRKTAVEEPKEDASEKVAIWSNKNIRWTNVGALSKGYNIVNKEAAEMWLTKDGIREATPDEVATYYSK